MPDRQTPRTITYRVDEVREGDPGGLHAGILTIDLRAIEALVSEDTRIANCRAQLAHPGDNTRMVHVLDSFRPVCSIDGPGQGAFPGVLSDPTKIDRSDSVELANVLVTMVGQVPPVDSFLTQQEGILDMSGPGAALSPLASQPHIVLELSGDPSITSAETSDAFRKAATRVAEQVASYALVPDHSTVAEPELSADKNSSRLIHICEVSAFGEMFNTLVTGASVIGMLPLLISDSAMRAGAVVSADYHYAGQRNYTCFYQRNPVADAIESVGNEAMLAGTVLLPVGGDNRQKGRGAAFAAHIAATLSADGAIVTAVAGGNAHLDVMFAIRECEARGIRSVLSLVEMAGPSGNDPGMVDTVPEADLIVSTGNREALITLPAIAEVIGGPTLFDAPSEESGGAPSDGGLVVPLRAIVGVNNEMGAWRVGGQLS